MARKEKSYHRKVVLDTPETGSFHCAWYFFCFVLLWCHVWKVNVWFRKLVNSYFISIIERGGSHSHFELFIFLLNTNGRDSTDSTCREKREKGKGVEAGSNLFFCSLLRPESATIALQPLQAVAKSKSEKLISRPFIGQTFCKRIYSFNHNETRSVCLSPHFWHRLAMAPLLFASKVKVKSRGQLLVKQEVGQKVKSWELSRVLHPR